MSGFLRNLSIGVAIASMTSVAGAPALAGPQTSPSRSDDHFSYSGAGDLNGFFGDPTIANGTFSFHAATFEVEAADGTTALQSDTFSIDLLADTGWRFQRVDVFTLGQYVVSETQENSVEADMAFSLTENDGESREWFGAWAPNPDMPITEGSGAWYGAGALDLPSPTPPVSDSLHFEWTIDLEAIAGDGGSALINLTPGPYVQFGVLMEPIPEPTTLSLLALGGLAALRRRR